ncbi:hypothetical protein G9A89_000166, partial [Geosiphon pyriformis]
MGACCSDNKEYQMATKFYCRTCHVECFERPKQVGKWDNTLCITCGETLLNEGMWNDILEREGTCDVSCQYTILISDWVEKGTPIEAVWRRAVQQLDSCPHNDDELWQMAIAKIEGVLPEEIRTIKNNPPEPIELDWNAKPVINFLESKKFYEHYQNLAPTRENDFEYCDNCDLIYNPPPCIIYTIPEEEKPISSCASESKLLINRNPDSNNDDKNTGSNNSNSDSNSNLNYEQYIALPDLFKKQELKWYSDNGEGIMSEHAYNTDTRFDLRYLRTEAIKLEPHTRTCIDLKVALEIPATTIVQLAFRSSLVKRGINIREEIIDIEYVGNIITMLQNDSEKAYVIEPNKKIAQTIFLPLIRVAQLVSVRKREKLRITAKEIQRFELTNRIDVSVNIMEKKIVGQGEIISTAIEKKEKDQAQIFEAEANLCELGE